MENLEITFEDEETLEVKNKFREIILEFMMKINQWQNAHQVKKALELNYLTVKRHLQGLTDNKKLEKMVFPYGTKRETEFWRINK